MRSQLEELCCQRRQSFGPSFRRAVLKYEVLALDVAQVSQSSLEGLHLARGISRREKGEESHAVHLPRLLGLGGERRGQRPEREHEQEGP